MTLYVGNLPHDTTDAQLRELFLPFGAPDSIKVVTDRDTGLSRGFAFVEFANVEVARKAMALNGKDFGGRPLTVNAARPRGAR